MPARKYEPPPEFREKMQRLVPKMEQSVEHPKLPAKAFSLNPVDAVVAGVNNLMAKAADSPIGRGINNASKHLPYLRERPFATPFGRVKLPEVKLPELHEIELDARKREALKAAVGIDASMVIAIVPIVGDVIADIVEDVHQEAVRDTLNSEEMRAYTRYDKLGPSTLAMARTFMRQ